jgi:hypothetical protein
LSATGARLSLLDAEEKNTLVLASVVEKRLAFIVVQIVTSHRKTVAAVDDRFCGA